MFFYSKKLVKCCKCGKKYSFDNNLYEHNSDYILQCPYCGLQHKVDISLLSKQYNDLKKVDSLNLTEITIGTSSITNRVSAAAQTFTHIPDGQANGSGIIDTIEVWFDGSQPDVTGFKVATFYISGGKWYTRDTESIGTVTKGSKQSIEVNLEVEEGDYLGGYWTTGRIEMDISGGNNYYLAGDNIPCSGKAFYNNDWILSFGGTGKTSGGEVAVGNPLFTFQNFITGFARIL